MSFKRCGSVSSVWQKILLDEFLKMDTWLYGGGKQAYFKQV